jgi:hypothetical protein
MQIIVVMALLIRVLTVWPALAGLAVTIAIIPTTMLLGKLLTSARRESMAAADQRIKLMTEVITGGGVQTPNLQVQVMKYANVCWVLT